MVKLTVLGHSASSLEALGNYNKAMSALCPMVLQLKSGVKISYNTTICYHIFGIYCTAKIMNLQ